MSNKYFIYFSPTLPSQKLKLSEGSNSNHTPTLLQHQYHTAISLLCHTVTAFMLPGLCLRNPVAMYHPKRCRPAEACGVTLSGCTRSVPHVNVSALKGIFQNHTKRKFNYSFDTVLFKSILLRFCITSIITRRNYLLTTIVQIYVFSVLWYSQKFSN